jgi:RNA-binding protein
MNAALTGKQKQYLKGLAHALSPVVRIGKGGVTQSVIAETKKSLDAHELIKIRIDVEDSSDRRRWLITRTRLMRTLPAASARSRSCIASATKSP